MYDMTPRLGLDYVASNQAQKHVTVNGGLWRLDGIVQMRLESRQLGVAPEEAELGACWAVPDGASGAWSDFAGEVVRRDVSGWASLPVPVGALAFVADEDEVVVRGETGWRPLGSLLGAVGPVDSLGVGAEAASHRPLTVAGPSSLFNADADGDHRLMINRAAPGDTASVIFQTAFEGGAEIGLCGSGAFCVRAAADGGPWSNVLTVTPSGRVGVNRTTPEAVVHVATEVVSDPVLMLSAHSDTNIGCNITGRKTRGTVDAPAGVLAGDRLLAFYARGWTGSGAGGNAAAIQMLAAEDFSSGGQGASISFETTAVGATVRRAVVAYQANGAMRLMPLAAAPASPTPGEVYFDQALAQFRGWTGSAWTTLG